VDADVARAEATRLAVAELEAERRWLVARAAVAAVVPGGAEIDVSGGLDLPAWLEGPPADGSSADLEAQALRLRGEIAASQMERLVLEHQVTLLRRERIPNPTLSGFVQRDGFGERVVGIGLSIPLPLPAPIGRTHAGELAETLARVRAAESSVELARRRVRLEVADALAGLRARRAALALYDDRLLTRARADLTALREGMGSRQVNWREGIVAQRSLIELLSGSMEARHGLVQASIEIRRVVGLPLVPGPGASP
jgi:cobalt-zinc-cadmium efflux system outer membrane protein